MEQHKSGFVYAVCVIAAIRLFKPIDIPRCSHIRYQSSHDRSFKTSTKVDCCMYQPYKAVIRNITKCLLHRKDLVTIIQSSFYTFKYLNKSGCFRSSYVSLPIWTT